MLNMAVCPAQPVLNQVLGLAQTLFSLPPAPPQTPAAEHTVVGLATTLGPEELGHHRVMLLLLTCCFCCCCCGNMGVYQGMLPAL